MHIISTTSTQTKKLGTLLAKELSGGEIICLVGDLGAGKTTFTQGLLQGLKIKPPYTSPTFTIIKEYKNAKSSVMSPRSSIVHHIDAYRITDKDLSDLGFADFAGKPDSITIIEWPERIKKIIPTSAIWIKFEWLSEKKRKLTFE